MKATAIAPSNIAFIKYWGKKDEELRLPTNGSISMNLSNLTTTTTVEFSNSLKTDEVTIDGQQSLKNEDERVTAHLDRIRKLAEITVYTKVVSKNNFPSKTGLSSSASGFAALTVAGIAAAGLKLSEKELSMLARIGSGSACRSIPSGFVEWVAGDSHQSSYALSLFPPDYWDIADVVAVVSKSSKSVSTSEGQKRIHENPFFDTRLKGLGKKLAQVKKLIQKKNFQQLGELIESESLELHAMMMTSQPSLFYLTPETVILMNEVWKWRKDRLQVYFTLNTGQDVHLICQGEDAYKVVEELNSLDIVKKVIINKPTIGAHLIPGHLF